MLSLKEIIDNSEYSSMGYSGRFMYGKECLAVSTGDTAAKFLMNICTVAAQETSDVLELEDFFDVLSNMKQDSLGLDSVYYFPNIEWVDEDEAPVNEEYTMDCIDDEFVLRRDKGDPS